MSNHYRINVRFDMSKEAEKAAAEYLAKLSEQGSGTRNRFIVEAVIEKINRVENEGSISLDDIRAMFREELQGVSFVKPASPPKPVNINTELTEEEKEENDASVMAALEMFG